jgi:hypothetical protein
MKKTALILGGMLALSLVATTLAQTTTNVYSKNAVGYVNMNLPTGFTLISAQLSSSTGSLTLDQVFGTTLPDSSVVFVFTPPSGPYKGYYYYDGMGWVDDAFAPAGTTALERTKGFWVNVASTTNVAVVGEVPSASTTSVAVTSGFALFAYPYPTPMALTNSTFNSSAHDSDIIYAWNGASYAQYQYFDGMGWVDDSFSPATLVLQTGKGYWYYSDANRNVDVSKPYLWP